MSSSSFDRRDSARDRVDELITEGDRYGLAADVSREIAERVCQGATDPHGRVDMNHARARFQAVAARALRRGGRLRRDPGKGPAIGETRDDDTDAFGELAPGKGPTRVELEHRRIVGQQRAVGQSADARLPGQDEVDAILMGLAGTPKVDVPSSERPDADVESRGEDPMAIAARGTAGPGGGLPHAETIQASFGRHDISGVRAHIGGDAAVAADQLDANAFAVGDQVGFASAPDLHQAAHEAAHTVQQQDGVQLESKLDQGAADPYEQHADAVADAVVAGESAEALLDAKPGGAGPGGGVVQRDSKTASKAPPSVTARQYVEGTQGNINMPSIYAVIGEQLERLRVVERGPYGDVLDGEFAEKFAAEIALDRELKTFKFVLHGGKEERAWRVTGADKLEAILAPELLTTLVDRSRPLNYLKDENGQFVKGETGPGVAEYVRIVALELASGLARRYKESIKRIFPRFVSAFMPEKRVVLGIDTSGWTPAKDNTVKPEQVLVSHPLDLYVVDALCQVQTKLDAKTIETKYAKLDTDSEPVSARGIALQMAPPGPRMALLYHWVKATPEDATVEEVAKSLFGKHEDAHRLIPMKPLWGFRARDVAAMDLIKRGELKEALENRGPTEAPDLAFEVGAKLPAGMSVVPPEVDPGLELAVGGGEQLALERAKVGAGPKPQGEAPKDEKSIISQLNENLKNLETLKTTIPVFQRPLSGLTRAIQHAQDRKSTASSGCLADSETPYALAAQQGKAISRIAMGMAVAASKFVKQDDLTRPITLEPILEVVDPLVAALDVIDLPELAVQRIDIGEERLRHLDIAILEAKTHNALPKAQSATEVNKVGGVDYDPDRARTRTEYDLHTLAALRIEADHDPAGTKKEVDALAPKVDKLWFDVTLGERLAALDALWGAINQTDDFWTGSIENMIGSSLKTQNRRYYERFQNEVWNPYQTAQKAKDEAGMQLVRTKFAELVNDKGFQAHAQQVLDHLERAARNKKWTKVIVAIGIAVVAFSLGQWQFAALAPQLGTIGAGIIAGVSTTMTQAVLEKLVLDHNSTAGSLAVGMITNIGTFVLIGEMMMAARGAALEAEVGAAAEQAVVKSAGAAAKAFAGRQLIQLAIAETMGIAAAQGAKAIDGGGVLTGEELQDVFVQQLIGAIGMQIGQFTFDTTIASFKSVVRRRGIDVAWLEREQKALKALGQQMGEKAKAEPHAVPDKASALELIARWERYLKREMEARRRIIELAKTHPELVNAKDIERLQSSAVDADSMMQLGKAKALLGIEQYGPNLFRCEPGAFQSVLAQHMAAGGKLERLATDASTGQRTMTLKTAEGAEIEIIEKLPESDRRSAPPIPIEEARRFESFLETLPAKGVNADELTKLRDMYAKDPQSAINVAVQRHEYPAATSHEPTAPKAGTAKADGKPQTPPLDAAAVDTAKAIGQDVVALGGDRFMAPIENLRGLHEQHAAQGSKPSKIYYDPESNTSHFDVEIRGQRVRVESMLEPRINSFNNLDAAPNRIVGRPVSADTGNTIMQRLVSGDGAALSETGIAGKHRLPADPATEFGLGELASGEVVVVRGERGAIDWSGMPGIKPKAHTHPDVPGNDLMPNHQHQRAESLEALFEPRVNPKTQREEPHLNRGLIVPSADDFIMMAQQAVDGHRVYTSFIIENGQVMKAPPGYQGARLEFTIGQPREVGLLPDGRRVYRATMEGHLGTSTPIHQEIWTVQNKSDASGHLFMREPPDMVPIDRSASRAPTGGRTRAEAMEPIPPTPGTKKFVEIPATDLENIHQRVFDHVKAALEHVKDHGPEVSARLTAAGREAAENLYRLKVGTGMDPAKARKQAGDAAKNAIKKAAPDEAKVIATTRAAAAVRDGTAFDMTKLSQDATTQLEDFRAGRSGGLAKQVAPQLAGKTLEEMQAILDVHVRQGAGTKTTQRLADPTNPSATQTQHVYEFTDGSLVRLKPRGDDFNPGDPMFSIEVKQVLPGGAQDGQHGIAFKVNAEGLPVPKGPFEILNPYEKGIYQVQHDTFKQEVLAQGHQKAQP